MGQVDLVEELWKESKLIRKMKCKHVRRLVTIHLLKPFRVFAMLFTGSKVPIRLSDPFKQRSNRGTSTKHRLLRTHAVVSRPVRTLAKGSSRSINLLCKFNVLRPIAVLYNKNNNQTVCESTRF